MKTALQLLVASQNLEQNWPQLVHRAGKTGAAKMRREALAALAANPALTDAQRNKGAALLAAWSPAMVDDIDASTRAIDGHALMNAMVESVYPQYVSPNDIRALAASYSGQAYQHGVKLEIRINEESARTGAGRPSRWAKYGSEVSLDDLNAATAVWNSPTGEKQQALGQAVTNDMPGFLQGRANTGYLAIRERYSLLQAEKRSDASPHWGPGRLQNGFSARAGSAARKGARPGNLLFLTGCERQPCVRPSSISSIHSH